MPLHIPLKSLLKPRFWTVTGKEATSYRHLFDFRMMWKKTVIISCCVAILPLICLTVFDYNITRKAANDEIRLRTARLVSNTRRTLTFFLSERQFALDFIINDNSFEELTDKTRLENILQNLGKGFKGLSGFADLGIIDDKGVQRTYVGPFDFKGIDYSDQAWFRKARERGFYISDIFLGYRNIPHLVIAVKHDLPDGGFYILRASLYIERIMNMLAKLEMSGEGDVFIINHEGILQTPSRYHSNILTKTRLPIPEFSRETRVITTYTDTEALLIGYAYIEDTPFILMVVKNKAALMHFWQTTRIEVLIFVVISILLILIVILSMVTYLVNNIYDADQKRVWTLHNIEYSDKMATIGRMAAGIAHEINNPLAIINEKAGLIQDYFVYQEKYRKDERLLKLVESIIRSVSRCGAITKRMLNFARQTDVSVGPIDIEDLLQEVLSFMGKEAEYRSIEIVIDIPEERISLENDRIKLQQVLFNIVKNAFAAMDDQGRLLIRVRQEKKEKISIQIRDNGCGIPEADLRNIFEPFFTTKSKRGGTGLGLSITYRLILELGGSISVKSEVAEGTAFTIILPLKWKEDKESQMENGQNASTSG